MRDCGNLPSRIRSGFGLASLSYFHDTGATPFGLFRSGIAMLQTVATTRYVHRGLKGPPHPVTVPTNFHRTPYVTRLVYGARATSSRSPSPAKQVSSYSFSLVSVGIRLSTGPTGLSYPYYESTRGLSLSTSASITEVSPLNAPGEPR